MKKRKTQQTDLRSQEAASDLIVSHKFNWCRARVFHALSGAAEQGVLVQVLDELFEDTHVDSAALADKVRQMWPGVRR